MFQIFQIDGAIFLNTGVKNANQSFAEMMLFAIRNHTQPYFKCAWNQVSYTISAIDLWTEIEYRSDVHRVTKGLCADESIAENECTLTACFVFLCFSPLFYLI